MMRLNDQAVDLAGWPPGVETLERVQPPVDAIGRPIRPEEACLVD
jgi:hypothetical protein